MASSLIHENIWYEKSKYEAAERQYYEKLSKDCEEVNVTKTIEITTESVVDNKAVLLTTYSNDKRSKKEKKNKKEKREKEVKRELKHTIGNPTSQVKQTFSGSTIGEFPKAKGKNSGFPLQEVEGYCADAVKDRDQHCQIGNKGYLDNRKADSSPNYKNASSNSPMKQSLASEVAKARQHIKQSLECMDGIEAMSGSNVELVNRINSLEKENATLHKVVADLKNLVISLDGRVKSLEGGKPAAVATTAKPVKKEDDDDDDGVDLFGSDSEEENEEAAKVREARLAAYADKKSKKPALIAKSNIILSVSPWDDETDMKKMEECVRTIEMDGLVWGASKLVPLAYGIHKLHISCVVEDDKVSVDLLQEKIQDFEDYVQSVDIAAFNKV